MKFTLLFFFLFGSVISGQWTQTNGPSGGFIFRMAIEGDNIYSYIWPNRLFLSSDHGNNWIEITNGIPTFAEIRSIAVKDSNIYAAYNQGIYISSNNGASWTNINFGGENGVTAFAFKGDTIYAASRDAYYPWQLWISTNKGMNWSLIYWGEVFTEVAAFAMNQSYLFAATGGDYVYRSSNDGISWIRLSNGLTYPTLYCLSLHHDFLFVGTDYDGIFRSTDNGDSWESEGFYNNFIHEFASSGANLFAATDEGVLLSTNNGAAWNYINDGLPALRCYSIAADNNYIYVGTDSMVWRRLLSDLVLPVELISFTSDVKNYIVTLRWETATEKNNLGFEIQRKSGDSDWSRIGFVPGKGTTIGLSNYMFTDNINIFFSAGDISYRLCQKDFNGEFNFSEILTLNVDLPPKIYFLSQNYPNPFNPGTEIRYAVKDAGLLRIELYDNIGRKVETIVNEFKEPGNYSVNYNAKILSSGVYFYRMDINNFSSIKKMVVLK